MRGLIILVSLLFCFQSYAQDKRGNVWVMGRVAEGINKQVFLDFNTEPAVLREFEGSFSMAQASVSTYSNQDGDIMLYTNGCKIVGRDHEIIENGDSIVVYPHPFNFCDGGWDGNIDGPMFLPQPCDDSKVNLLTLELISESFNLWSFNLYNTTIDLSDEDNPIVVENRRSILADTLAQGNVYASHHANGRDWWITVLEAKSDCFYSVLLNENGFSEPIKTCTGPRWSFWPEGSVTFEDIGHGCFSPDGKVYVRYGLELGLNVYDFDNTTGVLTHREQILISDTDGFTGAAISPNSRFVYASANSILYQYDLSASPVSSSEKIVAVRDFSIFLNPRFVLSRLAPNGKIYVAGFNSLDGIHIVHNPDLEGEACNVEQKGLQFPADMDHFSGLPNNPWYGAMPDSSPCDSLLSSTTHLDNIVSHITAFPNPTDERLTITAPADLHIERTELMDMQGVTEVRFHKQTSEVYYDLSDYPAGLYFVRVYTEKGSVVKKIVVE